MNFIKSKVFYKTLFTIAIPIALQNLISYSVGLMDTLMVGNLGEIQLSAVSIANQPFFVFSLIVFGLGGGASVLCSQYWGKKNIFAIKHIFALVIRFAFLAAVIFFLALQIFPSQIMSFYSSDTEVLSYAVSYSRIVSFSYFFFAISSTFIISMRSVESVKISVYVYIVSFFVNVFFNYVFIFGAFGMPKMGSDGAAVGTVIARIAEMIMIYIYSQFIDKKIKFRINDIFKFDKSLAKDFLKYSSPVVCNEFFWSLGTTITVAILAQYGTSVIAANTIATTVSQMVTVFAFGVANAAAVIVGKEIGSGNIKYAKQCATTLQIISFLFGIVLLIFLFLIKGFAIDLYSLTGESAAITDSFLVALAIIMPFQFFAATGIIGTFRGGGDTKYGFFCDMITIWIYAIPISAALTFFTDVSPILVFFIIKSEEIIKSFLVLFRLKNGRWLNIVTRDQ